MVGLRVATVYTNERYSCFRPTRMSTIRWLRMSEALARLGCRVDMVMDGESAEFEPVDGLRLVPWDKVRWSDYDVVKANYPRAMLLLKELGAADHPFLIVRLGSVIEPHMINALGPFGGQEQELLLGAQDEISKRARAVVVQTEYERKLWYDLYGIEQKVLVVPTGVNRNPPPPGDNPYRKFDEKIAVYSGNLRGETRSYESSKEGSKEFPSQRRLNTHWQRRLNTIGKTLKTRGVRLCVVGDGATDQLDAEAVTHMGSVDSRRVWDYHRHADAGIALAQGPAQIHECSKIYYYLRAGLPVVSEEPIPTNQLIRDTRMGLIAGNGDDETMADMICEAVDREWPKREAAAYMVRNHAWEERAKRYLELFAAAAAGGYKCRGGGEARVRV